MARDNALVREYPDGSKLKAYVGKDNEGSRCIRVGWLRPEGGWYGQELFFYDDAEQVFKMLAEFAASLKK